MKEKVERVTCDHCGKVCEGQGYFQAWYMIAPNHYRQVHGCCSLHLGIVILKEHCLEVERKILEYYQQGKNDDEYRGVIEKTCHVLEAGKMLAEARHG